MPGFDRTGPQGMGSMTGGARGRCNPVGAGGGYAGSYGYGRGFRGGFGAGRGMRRGSGVGFFNEANELSMLKVQASDMKGALDEINCRITELEKSSE